MKLTSAEYKEIARDALKGNWGRAIGGHAHSSLPGRVLYLLVFHQPLYVYNECCHPDF